MTPTRYFTHTVLWLLLALSQLSLPVLFDIYRFPYSVFFLLIALFTSGMLLQFFTLGVRRYFHQKKKDPRPLTRILNPLFGVFINAVVLFLMLMLIFNHTVAIINAFIQ